MTWKDKLWFRDFRRHGTAVLGIVPVQKSAQPAKYRSFFAAAAPQTRHRRNDPICQPAQRQGLQPNAARPAQRREEQTFTAEKSCFDFHHILNVVRNAGLECHDTARIDTQRLCRLQILLQEGAAGVDKRQAVALQPLHDEAFAAKQSNTELFLKRYADADSLRSRE